MRYKTISLFKAPFTLASYDILHSVLSGLTMAELKILAKELGTPQKRTKADMVESLLNGEWIDSRLLNVRVFVEMAVPVKPKKGKKNERQSSTPHGTLMRHTRSRQAHRAGRPPLSPIGGG